MTIRRPLSALYALALLTAVAWATSCTEVDVTTVDVVRVEVLPSSLELVPGETRRLEARLTGEAGATLTGREVTWSSTEPSVATVSNRGMVEGRAEGTTLIRASAEGVSGSATVRVGQGPLIVLSPDSVTLSGISGASTRQRSIASIRNGGGGTLRGLEASIDYGSGVSGWLEVAVGSSVAPTDLQVEAVASDLEPGTYVADVVVSSADASNSPRSLSVRFDVVEGDPRIDVRPSAIGFTATEDEPPPSPQTLSVTNSGGGELEGLGTEIHYGGDVEGWLSASLSSRTAPADLVLSVQVEDLPVGVYSAGVEVSDDAAVNSPVTVDVTLTVGEPPPEIALDPDEVEFVAFHEGPNPSPQDVQVTNVGGKTLSGLAATVSYAAEPGGWLTAQLESTTAPTELTLLAETDALEPGVHLATVSVASDFADNSPQTIDVAFQIEARADLEVTKVASPDPVEAGSPLTYTITVGSLGPSEATDVVVHEILPEGLTFSQANPSQGSYDAGAAEWTVGTLERDQAETLELVLDVSPSAQGPLENVAYVSSEVLDPEPANDTARISTSVTPPPPSDLEATAPSSGQIDLTWTDNADNEDGFEIERSTDGGTTWSALATVGADVTSYSDTGLDDDTTYGYRVRATAGAEVSDWSNTASATPLAAPTDLAATAVSTSQIDLTWTDNSDSEDGFEIERSTDGGLTWNLLDTVNADITSYSDTGLDAGTLYSYRVRATNAAGDKSDYSNTATATPLPAPTNLDATAVSSSQIDLTWTDNSDIEDGFEIERSTDGGTWDALATVDPNITSYSDTGLDDDTPYDYRVRATADAEVSDWSNTASATTPLAPPSAPSNLDATASSSGQIDLTWTDNSDNEDGFEIQRSTDGGSTWSVVDTVNAGITTYSDTGLQDNTAYSYRVRATNAAGDSDWSNTATATTPLAAPTNLDATAVTSSQIDLTWTDNSDSEDGFEIERRIDGGSTWDPLATVDADITSYSDTGLDDDTTYDYRVRATAGAEVSDWSNTASATTPLAPPSAPSNLDATAASSGQIDLTWTDNSDNEDGFEIQRSTDGGSTWNPLATVPADSTSYPDTEVQDNTSYSYRVRATNAAGDSEWSNTASATTPLAAPTDLDATAVSSSQIDLTWTDNSDSEDGFDIERSIDGGSTWDPLDTVDADITSYSDTGLDAGTTYHYRVRATAGAEVSDWSNTASATTP